MLSPEPIEFAVSHRARRVAFEPIRALLSLVAEGERTTISALSVVFADHAAVQNLNVRHLGRSYFTDVIAFDLRDDPGRGPVDGEIYIDLDTAAERAPEFGIRFTDEVKRYAVHGLLHLIGYRDDDEPGKQEMRRLEDNYLREFQHRVNSFRIRS